MYNTIHNDYQVFRPSHLKQTKKKKKKPIICDVTFEIKGVTLQYD